MKPTTARVLVLMQDGAWHSDHSLIEAAGQTQAGRRLRELRAAGYPIERRRIRLVSGKMSHAYEYRLTGQPLPISAQASMGSSPTQAALPIHVPEPFGKHWPP